MSPSVSFWFFLYVSLGLAMLFNIYPLPAFLSYLRPESLCLLVMYWVLVAPQRLGIAFAFSVGLLQSLVESSIWGGYSLALCAIVYLCLKFQTRLRNYSLVHQSLWVFIWIFVHQVIVSWVQGLAGYEISFWHQVASALLSATCWPFLFVSMNWLRRSYHVQ